MKKRKVVVVTGASAGLGRAIAEEFVKEGCAVALLSRNREALEMVRKDIVREGGEALVIPLDVADAEAVEAAASAIEDQLGEIDVWVNNAMVSVFSPVKEMTADDYRRVTEVTYLGYVHGTLSALRRMTGRDRGVIVQVGSALAHRAIPLQSAYCAAKHAIKGFTESLITELRHDASNVKVTMVHMPALNTPQFRWVKSRMPNRPQPVPPIFQPEVGARAVVYASKRAPRELLVGYPTMKAVLGENVLPSVIDRYLAKNGYRAQQTEEPANGRINNLFEPAPLEYYSEHGDFDSSARNRGSRLTYKQIVGLAVVGAISLCTASVGLIMNRSASNGGHEKEAA